MEQAAITQDPANYERFLLYVYLSAAFADFEIGSPEKDMICDKLEEKGLVSPADFELHWHKALADFKSHNDYESEQYITKCCEELNLDGTSRQKLYNDVVEIMEADGREDASEKVNLFKFKKILKIHDQH